MFLDSSVRQNDQLELRIWTPKSLGFKDSVELTINKIVHIIFEQCGTEEFEDP